MPKLPVLVVLIGTCNLIGTLYLNMRENAGITKTICQSGIYLHHGNTDMLFTIATFGFTVYRY